MQNDAGVLIDLRRDVEGNTRKEWSQGQRREGRGAACQTTGGGGAACDIGNEKLIGSNLEHGLLIIERGDTRTR